MERIEYRDVINKSDWRNRGPWDREPDKIQWQDEATGLPCLIVRGPVGSLCGYVGVPPGHPWHGKDYDDCGVEVHGGLTFADGCAEISRAKWEKWRERQLARKDEAARYPRGDAARDLRDWAKELHDYDAWEAKAVSRYICYKASPGEPDPVYWLGFDCAHAGDFCPSYGTDLGMATGWGGVVEYRNVEYVENECRSLAKQIADATTLPSTESQQP